MSARRGVAIALLLGAALAGAPAGAQRATEQFIPVGRSPGLSGVTTLVGRVEAVDAGRGVLTVSAPDGRHEVAVSDATRIWLDRSQLLRTNETGTLSDCRPQRTVEVKLTEDGAADWIKVRMPPTSGP